MAWNGAKWRVLARNWRGMARNGTLYLTNWRVMECLACHTWLQNQATSLAQAIKALPQRSFWALQIASRLPSIVQNGKKSSMSDSNTNICRIRHDCKTGGAVIVTLAGKGVGPNPPIGDRAPD